MAMLANERGKKDAGDREDDRPRCI